MRDAEETQQRREQDDISRRIAEAARKPQIATSMRAMLRFGEIHAFTYAGSRLSDAAWSLILGGDVVEDPDEVISAALDGCSVHPRDLKLAREAIRKYQERKL